MVEEKPMTMSKVAAPRSVPIPAPTLTPKEVLGILRRHTLLIIAMTVLGLVAGGGTWFVLKQYFPSYIARTYIEVLPIAERDPMVFVVGYPVTKDIQYGYRLSLASIITGQRTLEELCARDKIKQTDWYRSKDSIRKAVKNLTKRFVAYAQRDSDFIEIAMTCRSDRESALIVNEMLDLFLASQGGTKREEIARRLARLEDQRVRIQRDLDAANKAMDELRTAWGITDLTKAEQRGYWQHTFTIRLNDLELKKNELDLMVKETQADLKNLERLATGPITEQIAYAIERDDVMVSLAQQKALLEADLAGRLTKFGENHRVVRQTQELIDKIKEKREQRKTEIAEQLRQASLQAGQDRLVVMRERFAELEKMRQEADAKQKDLDLARVQYDQRLVVREERVAMLDSIKEQIEKLKIIHDDPETTKVRAVGYAPVPWEMVTTRQWWVWFPAGTILGFLLSIGLAFLMELANDLVRAPRDVGRYLHIPLLGVIPDAAEDSQVRGINLCHAVREAPYSIISESYRRCRTNLKLSSTVQSLKTLLVTSGMAGDGTTSVAVNLAAAFVAENKRALLIDANFRHSSLRALFPSAGGEQGEQFDFGLSSVLMNQCSSKEAIRSTGIEGLDIISSGPLPGNPAELLDSGRMQDLINEQRRAYDYVIIDGPPVLLVSDSKSLTKLVDGTLLVFNAAATRRGAAQRSINEIKQVGGTVAGCVLFAVRAMKGGYFQEQFKSYQQYQKVQLAAGSA